MDRCALFVDAGYLLADGAMAVHGTRHREAVAWDYPGLLQFLTDLARERTGLPLLRCYWYEATVEGRRTPEHDVLADIPGLKLRLARIRPGRREGVDAQTHRDLMTLAHNKAICDAVVVSGDEDLAQVVSDAQDLGIRVTVMQISADGSWATPRTLRQECDDLIEIGSSQLRPYVTLITNVEPSALPSGNGQHRRRQAESNGQGHGTGLLPDTNGASGGRSSGASQARPALPALPAQPSTTAQDAPAQPAPTQAAQPAQPPPASPAQPAAPAPAQSSAPAQPAAPAPLPPPAQPSESVQPSSPSYTGLAPEPQPLPSPRQAQRTPHQSPPASPPHAPATPPSNQYASGAGSYSPALGPYTGPQPAPVLPQPSTTTTLAEAVQAAHKEGHDFGDSVARDAPALWLEAVLARKPRMPSDLEARLLQGSSLPIDFLLHDEVRHALRRGFWDALERARQ